MGYLMRMAHNLMIDRVRSVRQRMGRERAWHMEGRNGDRVRLSVAEGVVAFDPQGANIRISAGRTIDVRGTTVIMTDAPAAAAGSWRSGRLVFQDAPLTDVADELTQSLGETSGARTGAGR